MTGQASQTLAEHLWRLNSKTKVEVQGDFDRDASGQLLRRTLIGAMRILAPFITTTSIYDTDPNEHLGIPAMGREDKIMVVAVRFAREATTPPLEPRS